MRCKRQRLLVRPQQQSRRTARPVISSGPTEEFTALASLSAEKKTRLSYLLSAAAFRTRLLTHEFITAVPLENIYSPGLSPEQIQAAIQFLDSYYQRILTARHELEELKNLLNEATATQLQKTVDVYLKQLDLIIQKVNALKNQFYGTSKTQIETHFQQRALEIRDKFIWYDLGLLRELKLLDSNPNDLNANFFERYEELFRHLRSKHVFNPKKFQGGSADDPNEVEEAALELYKSKVLEPMRKMAQKKSEKKVSQTEISVSRKAVLKILKQHELWKKDKNNIDGTFNGLGKEIFDVFIERDSQGAAITFTSIKRSKSGHLAEASKAKDVVFHPCFQEILTRATKSELAIRNKRAQFKKLRKEYLKAEAEQTLALGQARLANFESFQGWGEMDPAFANYYLQVLHSLFATYLIPGEHSTIFQAALAVYLNSLTKSESAELDELALIKQIYGYLFSLAQERDIKTVACPSALAADCQDIQLYVNKIVELQKWLKQPFAFERLHYVEIEKNAEDFYGSLVIALFVRGLVGTEQAKGEAKHTLINLGLFSGEAKDIDLHAVLNEKDWLKKYTQLLREKLAQKLKEKNKSNREHHANSGIYPDASIISLVRTLMAPRELTLREERDYQDAKTPVPAPNIFMLAREPAGFCLDNNDHYAPLITRRDFVAFDKKYPGQLRLRPPKILAETLAAKVNKLRAEHKSLDGLFFYLKVQAQFIKIYLSFDEKDSPHYFAETNAQLKITNQTDFEAVLLNAKKLPQISSKHCIEATSFESFQKEAACLLLGDILPLGNRLCGELALLVSNASMGVFAHRSLGELREILQISNTPIWDVNRHGEAQNSQVTITYDEGENVNVKLIKKENSPEEIQKGHEEYAVRVEYSVQNSKPEDLQKYYARLAHVFFEAVKNDVDLESDVPYRIYLGHEQDKTVVKQVMQHLVDAGFKAVICGDVVLKRAEQDLGREPARFAMRGVVAS